jgi:hypothetical protein
MFKQHPQKKTSKLNAMLPPRKAWRRFRPSKSLRSRASNSIQISLERCIQWHRHHQAKPTPVWLVNLDNFITRLRVSVIDGCFEFKTPTIIPQLKSGNDYRAIAFFPEIESKIVDIINARYLRETLDVTFEDASIAFRNSPKINRDSAVDRIFSIREAMPGQILYVTECDIRGFFDCVHHTVAKDALRRAVSLLSIRNPKVDIDPRAIKLFNRYLKCYSFSGTVLPETENLKARTKNDLATYKWPVFEGIALCPDNLKYYHDFPQKSKIGVPQGGAHSCLIANLILDLADKEVLLKLNSLGEQGLYLRYCDDIIIISSSQSDCKSASEVYKKCLEYLKLPYHLPGELRGGSHFYNSSKTKECYKWGRNKALLEFPWIQFLGYQIKYDCEVRIRKSSIEKQKEKINNLRESLFKELRNKPAKVSSRRLLYRFNSKIWAFTSGRVDPSSSQDSPLPMCWASGFRQLSKRKFRYFAIKQLDRCVGVNRRWLRRHLKKCQTGEKAKLQIKRTLKYFGAPFSHLRQFEASREERQRKED